MLEIVNTNYLNTLFLLPEIPVDPAYFDQATALLHMSHTFVQEHNNDDVIRFHRELGNPHAVLFAFHLMYETRKIHDSDLLAAPLYGAIDIGHSLRYVMKYGDTVYARTTGSYPSRSATSKEIVFFHHKIIPRGKPRSEMAGVHITNPKGTFLLDTMPPYIVEKFANAQKILFVDDSAGTFGSKNDVLTWLQNTVGPKTCEWVIAHGGIRWAKAQHASLREIVDAESIAATPLSKKFKNPLYGGGMSGYMPDAVIASTMLRTERTALTLSQTQNILTKLYSYGILHGVGYDLYETLVRRTVTREQRHADFNEMAAMIVSRLGYLITASEYEHITRPVWTGDIASMAQTHQEIEYFTTLHKMIDEIMRQKQYAADEPTKEAIIDAIAQGEFSYEKNNTIPNEGMHELLHTMNNLGVVQGIYSNTPYPEKVMHEIIEAANISSYIPLNRVLVSSATGIVKPGKESMILLAQTMGVNVENTAFVDNAATGVEAAMCARAIPIHYLFPEENLHLRNRIEKWQEFVRTTNHRTVIPAPYSVSK
jgi:beta-phosphoglucomutase-like phosphatase (HAD superfamily)